MTYFGAKCTLLASLAISLIGAAALAPTKGLAADATPKGPLLRYWALVDNPFPYPGRLRTVTVTGYFVVDGKSAAGVPMKATWNDGRSIQHCSSRTSVDGIAACTQPIRRLLLGGVVQILVSFDFQGKTYTTATGVLPQ